MGGHAGQRHDSRTFHAPQTAFSFTTSRSVVAPTRAFISRCTAWRKGDSKRIGAAVHSAGSTITMSCLCFFASILKTSFSVECSTRGHATTKLFSMVPMERSQDLFPLAVC